jgi:hypothetical protein
MGEWIVSLILPGVEIQVVKEIITGQLNPSGVLGLVGITENENIGTSRNTARASSFKEFKMLFGKSIDQTVPEAKQAFQNGVDEIVMVSVKGKTLRPACVELKDKNEETVFKLTARAPGVWGNRIRVKLENKKDDAGRKTMCKLGLETRNVVEVFDNLYLDPDHDQYFCNVINRESELVTAATPKSSARINKNKKGTDKKSGEPTKKSGSEDQVGLKEMPVVIDTILSGGSTATVQDFEDAIAKLESEEDVDLVVVSIEDYSEADLVKQVHSTIEAHCKVMSENCMNRIGFGSVPPPEMFESGQEEIAYITKQTLTMNSDRFVLVAPHGFTGAVAGLVGNLQVHESPTFKTLSGVGKFEHHYSPSSLKALLKANVLALEAKKGKGVIIEKGISTKGDQISVTRVADRAVRGTKLIGDQFIGTLNSITGRNALREKCIEFFLQMEKEGAIVPNADGSEPSHKVDVYATDDDISKGIVRLDIAVRPVRAIDYIYGTILVRA